MTDPILDRPLVTFALFAYNQERCIGAALEGALAQSYAPLEILITDDFSTDGTAAKIEKILSTQSEQTSILLHRNQKNLGWNSFGQLISEAVERAKGEIVVLAAGDDISSPDRVQRLVDTWIDAGRPSGVVHSAFQTMSDSFELDGQVRREGREFGSQTPLEVIRNDGAGLLGATMAFTRDLYTQFGALDDETVFEDRVFGFRAILAGQVIYLDEPLVRYRMHAENVSGPNIYTDAAKWERFCRGHQALYKSFREDFLKMHAGETVDHLILSEIIKRAQNFQRTEKLVSGTRFERALAAWHVTSKQRNWRYRVLFVLKQAGLKDFLNRTRYKRPSSKHQQ